MEKYMFGYLLLALSLSAFCGAFFFIITGDYTGVGLMAFIISIVWGIRWQIKKKEKRNKPTLIKKSE